MLPRILRITNRSNNTKWIAHTEHSLYASRVQNTFHVDLTKRSTVSVNTVLLTVGILQPRDVRQLAQVTKLKTERANLRARVMYP